MDPELVIFAIESAIRLGAKINEVLLDETANRDLVLPLGRLFGDIDVANAADYFEAHPDLVLPPDAPFHGYGSAQRLEAFKALVAINRKLGRDDTAPPAIEVVRNLQALEQFAQDHGPAHPAQRIVGTLIEIGIDYFAANPKALGKESSAKRIVRAFVARLDDVDFAEPASIQIASDVLNAALQTLDEHVTLVDDDTRLRALLHGVTSAMITELDGVADPGDLLSRKTLVRRLGSSVLRGGAAAFTEHVDLFLRGDADARSIVQATLSQVMAGVRASPDLFTNESLELIFRSGLRMVGQNAPRFSGHPLLQGLIASTATALTDAPGKALFPPETVAAVIAGALAVTADHAGTLVDADDAASPALARAVRAMAAGLSDELGAGQPLRDLLSRRQLIDLSRSVFTEVARDPDGLVGRPAGDVRRSALAQAIASVATALGDDPSRLVDGHGVQQLVQTALGVAARNAHGLLDLDDDDPRTNPLFRAVNELVTALGSADDPRRLISRRTVLDLAAGVLPAISANLAPWLASQEPLVERTVGEALRLADGALRGRIDAENLPALVRGMLVEVLWGELDLGDEPRTVAAATRILRAAT